jgi:hypothetical protein
LFLYLHSSHEARNIWQENTLTVQVNYERAENAVCFQTGYLVSSMEDLKVFLHNKTVTKSNNISPASCSWVYSDQPGPSDHNGNLLNCLQFGHWPQQLLNRIWQWPSVLWHFVLQRYCHRLQYQTTQCHDSRPQTVSSFVWKLHVIFWRYATNFTHSHNGFLHYYVR